MGSRQVVALGLRLLSVWLCIAAFQVMAILWSTADTVYGRGMPRWSGFAAAGVMLLAAWLIWMCSAPIARGLMSGIPAKPDVGFSAQALLTVGCTLLGLWWLKESLIPLIGLVVRSMLVSQNTAQSAAGWLVHAALEPLCMGLVQLALGCVFVVRARQLADCILRHAQRVPEKSGPFDALLARATQLGARQTARADILADLVEQMAAHPSAPMHLSELMSLLGYKGNPFTRGVAARVILRLGPAACAEASDVARGRWAQEDDPEVADLLGTIVREAGEPDAPDGGAPATA